MRVSLAQDGRSALGLQDDDPADVFLDLHLPDTRGRRHRVGIWVLTLKSVVVSRFSHELDVGFPLAAGLRKPVDLDRMRDFAARFQDAGNA